MAVRFPLEYELEPRQIEPGTRWLTLSLKNVGDRDLTSLDVRLNSLDDYSISVLRRGVFISALQAGEEKTRAFQVTADLTGRLYVTVDGYRGGTTEFHWETPGILVTVGAEVAELVSLFALTEPYPAAGSKIRCQAQVRSLRESEGMTLEFWAQTPGGQFEELTIRETEHLDEGEGATYTVEITPEEEGTYIVHAYLYDERARRIGHELDRVYVVQAGE